MFLIKKVGKIFKELYKKNKIAEIINYYDQVLFVNDFSLVKFSAEPKSR